MVISVLSDKAVLVSTHNNEKEVNFRLTFSSYYSLAVNSGYLSPQDYLNNPMFDSLNNASRGPKLSWSIGDGSGDRTITLKPLANVLNPKKRRKSTASSLQRKFGVNSSSMVRVHA